MIGKSNSKVASKQRIFLLVDDYLPSSSKVAAKMCHELAQELIRMGHNVIVVTPEPSLNTASTLEVFEGVQVLRFKTGKLKGAKSAQSTERNGALMAGFGVA